MKKAEQLALDLTLCEYPEGLTFDEIMEVLRNDSQDVVTFYYLYDEIPYSDVATIIEEFKDSIERVYGIG